MPDTFGMRFRMIFARVFAIGLSAAAIAWATAVVPGFWSESGLARVAAHIVAGEAYKPDVLDALEADLSDDRRALLRPSALAKVAILRLRRAEDAIGAGNRQVIDARVDSLRQALDAALTNAPSDSFLWLILFWLYSTPGGVKPEHLGFLG